MSIWGWLLLANYVTAVFFVGHVLRRRKEPVAMLAWIFSILALPLLGMFLYAIAGSTRVRRRASRRRRRIAHLISRAHKRADRRTRSAQIRAEGQLEGEVAGLEQLARRLTGVPATSGNSVKIYEEANATYYAIEEAIQDARHHIHLEYYIWQPDTTGVHFRELLIRKAKEGVRCRLLLDSVGSWAAGTVFLRPLIEAGVRVAFFLPVNPLRKRWSLNLRNHRKIVVTDGRIGFTGSQNIGDEYLGRRKKLSPWRDSHLRLEGTSVLYLQQIFAEDWYFATGEDLTSDESFPPTPAAGESIVQILATGPDQETHALEQIIFGAVTTARKSIRIATPYFVPGPEVLVALVHAAYRGVKVQMILPTRHDSAVVLWAGRSFYAELLQAGIEIYEYDHGVLHSKIIVVDDTWCMVGSANMDVRSFRLNFEITALIYDPKVAMDLSYSIERDRLASRVVLLRDVWNRSVGEQLIEGACRLLAPLL